MNSGQVVRVILTFLVPARRGICGRVESHLFEHASAGAQLLRALHIVVGCDRAKQLLDWDVVLVIDRLKNVATAHYELASELCKNIQNVLTKTYVSLIYFGSDVMRELGQ